MPIQHAVLALLAEGPSHGYSLKTAFERSVGPQWGLLNIGHLYQVLDRLSRDGLVTAERVAQKIKPDRVVYEITANGRRELDAWLAQPSARGSGYRDDFFLKVMAAARSGDPAVICRVTANQRTFLVRELRNLTELRAAGDLDPVVDLLLAAIVRHVTADLAFLDDVEEAKLHSGLSTMATTDQSGSARLTPRGDPDQSAARRAGTAPTRRTTEG